MKKHVKEHSCALKRDSINKEKGVEDAMSLT